MVDITEISAIVAALGVVVGVVYYIVEIRHETKLRETDLILRIDERWTDTILQHWQVVKKTEFKNYDDYEEKCPVETSTVGSFFDDLGLLVWRGLVDIDIISELFTIEPFWQKLKLWVEGKRKIGNDPDLYSKFEYLYREWKKRKEQKLQQSKA